MRKQEKLASLTLMRCQISGINGMESLLYLGCFKIECSHINTKYPSIWRIRWLRPVPGFPLWDEYGNPCSFSLPTLPRKDMENAMIQIHIRKIFCDIEQSHWRKIINSISSSRELVSMELPDRFSCLPKELWRDIVSFLPLEDAVSTSILSKAWREIWYSFPNLIFKYNRFPEMERKEEKFIEFIQQTIARHDMSNLETFELHLLPWDGCEIKIQSEWISFALCHNVKKIFLSGDMHDYKSLPDSLFVSKSLVILDLVMPNFLLEKLENVFLPNLKELRLRELMIDEHAIEVLLPNCPSLEFLSIVCCDFFLMALTISASRLKRLILFQCEGVDYNCLKLRTPMLLNLTLLGNIAEDYECMSMPFISSVFISFLPLFPDEGSRNVVSRSAFKLYGELQNATELFLNQWFIEFLSWAPDTLSKLATSSLGKLGSLNLYVWPIRKHIEIMMLILSRCPNLRELDIVVVESPNATLDLPEPNHQSERWTRAGILNHLIRVNIYRFEGNENELEILRLLLENAPSLISLKVLSNKEAHQINGNELAGFSSEILEKISTFRSASPTAIIEFSS